MKLSKRFSNVILFIFIILTSACSTQDDKIPTKNRIPILGKSGSNLKQSNDTIKLPRTILNNDWTQISGLPFNDIGNLKAINTLENFQKIYIGSTQDGDYETTMQPVISTGKAFFYNTDNQLVAIDLETKKVIWEKSLLPKEENNFNPRGGGIATDGNNVYVTTSYGLIKSLNAETGKQNWIINNKVPFNAAPTLSQGILYTIDRDNRLQSFNATTGKALWDYRGLPESVSYPSVASPSVFGSVLIVPFTSGELTAINIKTQKPVWGQNFTNSRFNLNGVQFNTISSEVIISNRVIYASMASGITTAIDGNTGEAIWRNEIGSPRTMLSAGNALFIVDNQSVLYAINKNNGQYIWKTQLKKYQDTDIESGIVRWTSPIMSNDKIILFSNIGEALIIDAINGDVLKHYDDSPETIIDPIIANGKLFLHAKNGYVYIYN